MDHKIHQVRRQAADLHAGHKMSEASGSHDRHAGHSVAMFRDKFWLSFALTIPVIFWSTDVQHWLGYTAPSFPGSNLIAPILGTAVFLLAKRDRKSTRLNSSHGYISYAVFCLKKKKKHRLH